MHDHLVSSPLLQNCHFCKCCRRLFWEEQPWHNPLWLTGLKTPTNFWEERPCSNKLSLLGNDWPLYPVKRTNQPGWLAVRKTRSGELRTQKLKSHLIRTQSLNVLPLKPGVGQYMAMHATFTARDFFLANFYPSGPFTCICFQNLSRVFPVLAVANTSSCVGPQTKIGHPAGCRFPCWVLAEYK